MAVSRRGRELSRDLLSFSCDVKDKQKLSDLRRLSGPADLILYAISPGGPLESDYEAAYSSGLRNVLEAFPEARTILISSTRAFGRTSGAIIDDYTQAVADDACAACLLSGEEAVIASNPRNVVLRASGIYGPGRTRTADSLLTRTLSPEEMTLVTNRIHRDDLARAVLFVAGQEQGGIFIASDPCPTALGVMQEELKRVARTIGFTPPAAEESAPKRRAQSRTMKPVRLLERGFQFQFPSFVEGYADIFAERVRSGVSASSREDFPKRAVDE